MDRHERMNGDEEMREVRFHDHETKKQNSWGQKSKLQNVREGVINILIQIIQISRAIIDFELQK